MSAPAFRRRIVFTLAVRSAERRVSPRSTSATSPLLSRAGRNPVARAPWITAAASASTPGANVARMPGNLRLFLPDPDGADAYPIVTLSWLLLHERYADRAKALALKKFVTWGLTDGQRLSRDLGYIPLPPEVAALSLAALQQLD